MRVSGKRLSHVRGLKTWKKAGKTVRYSADGACAGGQAMDAGLQEAITVILPGCMAWPGKQRIRHWL